jgi:hypothetical protein
VISADQTRINDIATVKGQIRQIDDRIGQLIVLRGSSQNLTTHSILDADISKLKSEREMLMVKLTALHQPSNK